MFVYMDRLCPCCLDAILAISLLTRARLCSHHVTHNPSLTHKPCTDSLTHLAEPSSGRAERVTSADTQVDLDAAGEDSAASMLACGTVSVGAAEGALVAAGGKEEVRTYRIPTGRLWLMLCFVVRWGSM